MSLFNKDIDPMCLYCQHSHDISAQQVACVKHGLKAPTDKCRKFRYDPLRRVPPRPKKADFSGLTSEDFSL